MKRIVLLFPLFFLSCWVLPLPQRVTLLLPDAPPGWPMDSLFFTLCYEEAGGRKLFLSGLSGGGRVVLELPRGSVVPLILYPHPDGAAVPFPGLRCAGGVYPVDCNSRGELPLTWEAGFEARLLGRLRPEERACLNLARLRDAIEAAGPDPWKLDSERLLDALLFHRFTSSSVKSLGLFPFPAAELPAGGVWGDPLLLNLWMTENQDSAGSAEEETSGDFYPLYPGIHLYAVPAGGTDFRFFRIGIDNRFWKLIDAADGVISSGSWE